MTHDSHACPFRVAAQIREAAPQRQHPLVYIVLLNWNGWHDTVQCVRSIQSTEYQNWRIVIVDNGSTDDSVDQLKASCPGIPLIETGKNLGFAAGNNVGIRFALNNEAKYVFALNNDTTVFPDTVSNLVAFAERHVDAAVIGPNIESRDPQREWPRRRRLDLLTAICTSSALRHIVARIPLVRRVFYYRGAEPARVQFLAGSALFFRASAFQKTGLFDESTFLDFEELIMAEKVRRAGYQVCFVPQARIWHKVSASAARNRAKRDIENARSEEYFLSNYVRLSSAGRSLVKLVRFVTYGLRALRYRSYRQHFNEFVRVLRPHESIETG